MLITSTVSTKFERKLLQSIDGADIRVHFGNGNKRLLKPNRSLGGRADASDKSKVDVLSGIFRNSVQQIRSKTKRIDVVYVMSFFELFCRFFFRPVRKYQLIIGCLNLD